MNKENVIIAVIIKCETVMLTQRDVIKCAAHWNQQCQWTCVVPPQSHITNVSPSLDLFATVGEPVVNFQGGDPLQVRQLLPWNKPHDSLIAQCITFSPEPLPLPHWRWLAWIIVFPASSNLFLSCYLSAPSSCGFNSYFCFYKHVCFLTEGASVSTEKAKLDLLHKEQITWQMQQMSVRYKTLLVSHCFSSLRPMYI